MVGATGHHILFDQKPVFEMGYIASPSISALLACCVMGLVIGLLSVFVSKAVYIIEEGFEKLPIHWMWWPAIGGLLVGTVGYFSPRTLGVGYENITDVLSGSLTMQVVLSLCIFKFISWAIALGSGTSGGTLAPLLTIGGATGALLGMAVLYFFPSSGITIPLAALVGMAAMFAGASRALLTSIVFALETTYQSNALLPILITCVAAYLVSLLLMEHTIMTEKIARRGVKTPHSYEPDILDQMIVEQVVNDNGIIIGEDNSVNETREWLKNEPNYKSNYFIVSNSDGEYKGIISSSNLFSEHHIQDDKIGALIKRNSIYIKLDDSLRFAAETMSKENIDVLPVISEENKNIVGLISYRDILATYKYGIDEHEMKRPNISLKRSGLKVLLQGQKLIDLAKRKNKQ